MFQMHFNRKNQFLCIKKFFQLPKKYAIEKELSKMEKYIKKYDRNKLINDS